MRTTRLPRFRRLPWLCLLLLAVGALAPPASAAPMKGMRPSEAFRMLAREVKDDLQTGNYTKAESGARRLYERFGDSGNDIESSGATTLLGRILREQGKYAEAETLLRQALASRRERIFGERPTTIPSPTDSSWRRRSFRSANTPTPRRYLSARWMPNAGADAAKAASRNCGSSIFWDSCNSSSAVMRKARPCSNRRWPTPAT